MGADSLAEDEEKAYGLDNERIWFGDRLDAQSTPEFRTRMWEKAKTRVFLYPGATSDKGLAPVDNGLGAYVKYKISQLQEDWLENDSNMDKWEANLLTASERRVLIVKWAAIAVEAAYSR